MCEVTCCDECSKKRITLESKEVCESQFFHYEITRNSMYTFLQAIRCCDGCFNRVFAEVEAEKKAVFLANIKPLDSAIVINDLNRKQLFDGSSTANSDSTRKISDLNTETHKSTVASTANVLSEARQNLEERGEKLSQLADKTDKLAAASSDFAEMAKQLKKQQQRSSWWG